MFKDREPNNRYYHKKFMVGSIDFSRNARKMVRKYLLLILRSLDMLPEFYIRDNFYAVIEHSTDEDNEDTVEKNRMIIHLTNNNISEPVKSLRVLRMNLEDAETS